MSDRTVDVIIPTIAEIPLKFATSDFENSLVIGAGCLLLRDCSGWDNYCPSSDGCRHKNG